MVAEDGGGWQAATGWATGWARRRLKEKNRRKKEKTRIEECDLASGLAGREARWSRQSGRDRKLQCPDVRRVGES